MHIYIFGPLAASSNTEQTQREIFKQRIVTARLNFCNFTSKIKTYFQVIQLVLLNATSHIPSLDPDDTNDRKGKAVREQIRFVQPTREHFATLLL